MTLEEFTRFLRTKSVGRTELPDNEQISFRIHTGMMKIAKDTTPLRLVASYNEGTEILRKIDSDTYVRFPKRPIKDSGLELDLDDELMDALALYVMAGLEIQRSKVLMGMYWEEIDKNNQRLIETYLEEATNDAERFYQFP